MKCHFFFCFSGLISPTVDAKNSLDSSTDKDVPSDYFVRPPANLVVLEGDCLDASGDSGELESYLVYRSATFLGKMLDSAVFFNHHCDIKIFCSWPPTICLRISFC